jgi:GH25 family lysozyme M1 (1,4-beta-N-acetylmuramidase)
VNRRGAHGPTLIAALTALIIAITGLVTAIGNETSNQHIVNRAQGNLKKRAVQAAVVAANETGDKSCNPAPGAGKLGICGPTQSAGATNALAKVAGDPFDVARMGPLGIDVSSYQPCGSAGPRFSFYKATEGTYYTDGCLRANVAASKRLRRPFGAYDFLRPGSSSPEAEGAHFVAAVKAAGATGSLPPVADVEANRGLSPGAVLDYVCRWHRYVRSQLGVRTTITYTGYWFWQPQVAASSCGTLLWISAYASQYSVPHGFSHAVIWQHSDGRYGPTRLEAKGHLGAFGTKRREQAKRYFIKNHDKGKTNYDCFRGPPPHGHVRVRVL